MRSATARPSVYVYGSDATFAWVAAAFMITSTVEAPLRYVLALGGAQMALYARDVAAAAMVGLAVANWVSGQASAFPVVATLAILVLHTLIGVMNVATVFQALFGLKIFLPFLLGMAVGPALLSRPRAFKIFGWSVFLTTAVGVLVSKYVEFPWVGMAFETAFNTVEIGRQWWYKGELRLPGFTRSSFSAAMLLNVSIVPVVASLRNPLTKFALIAFALWVVVLTTTKGAITGLAGILIDDFFFVTMSLPVVANVIMFVVLLICIALPHLSDVIVQNNTAIPYWLISFMDRAADMWPRALRLLKDPGDWIWGRGLGGLGMAQTFSERDIHSAGDNLMLYVLVICGLLGFGYVGYFLYRVVLYCARRSTDDYYARTIRGFTAVWLAYGITTNMVEDGIIGIPMGIAFGLVFADAKLPTSRRLRSAGSSSIDGPPATPLSAPPA